MSDTVKLLTETEQKYHASVNSLIAKDFGWDEDVVNYYRLNPQLYKISNQVKFYPLGVNQANDDTLVADFFKNYNSGKFLCIGSANGIDQTASLLQNGWSGVYCDPDPYAWPGLLSYTESVKDRVTMVNSAITPSGGIIKFYISDTVALSSVNPQLAGSNSRCTILNSLTLNQLLDYVGDEFDYVQIDIEGIDHEVVKSIDLGQRLLNCKMIGIESGLYSWRQLWSQGNYILSDVTEHNSYYRRLSMIDSNKNLIKNE